LTILGNQVLYGSRAIRRLDQLSDKRFADPPKIGTAYAWRLGGLPVYAGLDATSTTSLASRETVLPRIFSQLWVLHGRYSIRVDGLPRYPYNRTFFSRTADFAERLLQQLGWIPGWVRRFAARRRVGITHKFSRQSFMNTNPDKGGSPIFNDVDR